MRKRKSSKKNYKILALSLLASTLTGGLVYYGYNNIEKGEAVVIETTEKRKTVYPTQYSDKHITENAIISDPKLRSKLVIDRGGLIANVGKSIIKENPASRPGEPERGTWLWTPLEYITPEYMNQIFTGAKKNGIRNIYLSIDSYLDIFAMEDGQEKDKKKKKFDETLEKFIIEAGKYGITVDAEAGWRNWAEKGHEYKAFATLNYAIEFNKTHEAKLRGFQFDVEPYVLDYYQDNKKKILKNFLSLMNQSVTLLNGSDLEFTVVIPEFYDYESDETPKFFYAWRYDNTFDHLLRALERRDNSKIIVMSYRNFSKGYDGSIDISQGEIESANKYNTKVILAQETGDVPPAYITFYNTSHRYYGKEVSILEKEFMNEKSFGGIAVHYINAYMELK